MAWLSAPSGLKRSAIDRGIDFGHHIQDSPLLSFTTAEATASTFNPASHSVEFPAVKWQCDTWESIFQIGLDQYCCWH